MKKFNYLLAILALLGFLNAKAQSLEVRFVELKNNKVVLHYNLTDTLPGRVYTVRVYSSLDNYLNPLRQLKGDIGMEIAPGSNKTIEWDALAELEPGSEVNVSLEIRCRVFIPFISLDQLNQFRVFKRKRAYNITWTGGTPQNILNFDLYSGEKKVMTFPNVSNVGHHKIEFPAYIKPGKQYRFRVRDIKNQDEVVVSELFRIRRKIPLLVKSVPLLGLLAGTFFIIQQRQSVDETIGLPITPTSR